MEKAKKITIGLGKPMSLLGIILVVLKLMEKISLPWIWVLAPFWAPWAFVCAIVLFCFIGLGIGALVEWWRWR